MTPLAGNTWIFLVVLLAVFCGSTCPWALDLQLLTLRWSWTTERFACSFHPGSAGTSKRRDVGDNCFTPFFFLSEIKLNSFNILSVFFFFFLCLGEWGTSFTLIIISPHSLHFRRSSKHAFHKWFTKPVRRPSSINLTCELVRNVNFWLPLGVAESETQAWPWNLCYNYLSRCFWCWLVWKPLFST